MNTTSTPLRIVVGAVLVAAGALTLTGCSASIGGTGLSLQEVQDRVDLPTGVPDSASDVNFTQQGKELFVSWKGDRVDDSTCVEDGSSVPSFPEDVARGGNIDGTVEQCDFGHQVTSGKYTYIWMKK